LKDSSAQALAQAQHVDGAVHARLGGLHWVVLIMDGRSGTGEIVDLVHFHIEREGDVVPDDLEVFVIEQVLDIPTRAGEEIIDADDDRSIGKQAFAEMGAEETRATCHQYSLLKVHLVTPR
jgi:hypothetical protein